MTDADPGSVDGNAAASTHLRVDLTVSDTRRRRPLQLAVRVLRPLLAVISEGGFPAAPALVVEVTWTATGVVLLHHNWHDMLVAAQADLEMIQRDLARLSVREFMSEYGIEP